MEPQLFKTLNIDSGLMTCCTCQRPDNQSPNNRLKKDWCSVVSTRKKKRRNHSCPQIQHLRRMGNKTVVDGIVISLGY